MDDGIPDSWRSVITVVQPPPETPALSWADMIAAWEKVTTFDATYVLSDSIWTRIMNAATLQEREELERLHRMGVFVVSSLLPRNDCVYRIARRVDE